MKILRVFLLFFTVFAIKDPKDIIISDEETVILDLDDYFINGNLPFTITNPHAENFHINLTDTFVLKKKPAFRHEKDRKFDKILRKS